MGLLNSLFSQVLGGFGGVVGGAGGAGSNNPFSGVMGGLSNVIGGPGGGEGTLFSLPNEMLTNIADLGTSKNFIGDTLGLAKPVLNLGDKALGGVVGNALSSLNPFGSGVSQPGSNLLSSIPLDNLLPLGLGAFTAMMSEKNK